MPAIEARLAWKLWWFAVFALTTLTAFCSAWVISNFHGIQSHLPSDQDKVRDAGGETSSDPALLLNTKNDSRHTADFTTRLPDHIDEKPFLAALQAAVQPNGVRLVTLQVARTVATDRSLGRVAVQVALQGAYLPSLTAVQAVLRQFPDAGLQSLRFVRGEGGEVETALQVNLWGRPRATSPPTP